MNERLLRWGKYSVAFSLGWFTMSLVASKMLVDEQRKQYEQAKKLIDLWKGGYEWYLARFDVSQKHLRLLTNEFIDRYPDVIGRVAHEMHPDYVFVDANAPETVSQLLQELEAEKRGEG